MGSLKRKAEQFIANRKKRTRNALNKQLGPQRFLPTNDCIPKNFLLARVACEKEEMGSNIGPTSATPKDILGVGTGGILVLVFCLICILCKYLGRFRPVSTT